MINNLDMTDDERAEIKIEANRRHSKTESTHINQIGGWNDGKLHTLISDSGAGKSTYIRSIIQDFLKCNPDRTCFVWLSEITTEDFRREVAFMPSNNLYKRLYCYSEMDNLDNELSQAARLNSFIEIISTCDCDLIIIDNLTTSQVYEGLRPDAQGKVCIAIKQMCIDMKKPIIQIAHTGGTHKGADFIEMNDVRGAKHIVNLSEFFFILQTFQLGKRRVTTIRPTKYRGKSVKEYFFMLPYDEATLIYGRDICLTFDEMKKIWDKRNKK